MKKQKTKLAVALLALACAGVCVGAGAAYVVPSQANGVAAQAETTYTTHEIGTLSLHVNSTVGGAKGQNNVLYLQREDGGALPILTWDEAFTTSDGFKTNGEVKGFTEMKSTGDGMYFSFSALNAGDVITIEGEYVCEAMTAKYVIAKSQFMWNGSGWEKYIEVEYTTYEIGALQFFTMEPNKSNMAYFNRVDGEAIPIKSTENGVNWTTAFHFLAGSGVGITLNGQSITPTLKFPDQVFLELSANPSTGDVLTIGGTFYSQDLAAKYVITESSFKFNGTNWESYTEDSEDPDVPEITYKEYNVSELIVHMHSVAGNENANNTTLWLYGTGDNSDAWAYYTCESGVGVLLNGEALSCNVQDFGGGLYIKDFSVSAGDVITIGGTFVNEERATKYIIPESKFTWDGSGWSVYTPPVVYVEYTISNLQVANTSMAGGAYVSNSVLSLTMEGGATTSDWPWFIYESGAGFKVNGESAALTGNIANGVQDTNGGLYFQFAGVNSGDVVSIGGTFVNKELGLKYVIEETAFIWKGTTWVSEKEDSIVYDTYEVGTLNFSQLYPNKNMADFARADGQDFVLKGEPGGDKLWNTVFSVREDSGVGVTVNGVMVNATVKFPLLMFVELPAVPNEDDVLVIGGTFYNAELAVEYVVTESTFIYDGAIWVNKLDIEKESAIDELREYRDSFVEDDYYEAEWDSLDTKVEEGAAAIKAAMTSEEIAAALEAAKAALDNVVTKAESDAIFNELKESSKTELESYKEEAAYRANEWAAIQEIIAEAKAAIDVAQSVTDIENAVNSAHTKMDAVKTDAQWTEAEGVIAAAKAELDGYVNAEDYRDVEWAKIEAIIADANTEIDAVPFDSEAIAQIVVNAKAAIDEVFTKVEAEAAEAVVSAAKAEIAEYKAQADYHDAEWAEIQAIITEANGKLDKAFGNDEAIAQIVADTKAAIDEVKTAAVVDAEALAAAKAAADEEALAFYGSLDFTKYTDQDIVIINGYVEAVRYEIEQATTQEEINTALEQFKAKVNGIETTVPPVVDSTDKDNDDDDDDDDDGGCGSVVTGGLSVGVAMAAAVVVAIRRKKED